MISTALQRIRKRVAHLNTERLESFWIRRRTTLVGIAIALTSIAALWRLSNELPRLLFEADGPGALDLRLRYDAVRAWFEASTFFDGTTGRDYPPASYAMFWPLMGWMSFETTRALWAVVTVASLFGFAALSVRAAAEASPSVRTLLALVPFGGYASSAAIRVGQTSPLALCVLLLALVLMTERPQGRGRDLLVGLLLPFALIKPTLTGVPILVIFLLPGHLAVSLICVGGYLLLTALAAVFRPESLLTLIGGWLGVSDTWENYIHGHAHLYRLLTFAGLETWFTPATLIVVAVFAGWVLLHRRADVWTLVGAAAIVDRLAIYHRLHDDGLLFLTLIALLRIACGPDARRGPAFAAGVLFALNWAAMLAPGSLLNEPGPLKPLAESAQAALWLLTLGFLLWRARWSSRKD